MEAAAAALPGALGLRGPGLEQQLEQQQGSSWSNSWSRGNSMMHRPIAVLSYSLGTRSRIIIISSIQ